MSLLENLQEARRNINEVWNTLVDCSVPDEALTKLNNAINRIAEAEEEVGIFFSGQI